MRHAQRVQGRASRRVFLLACAGLDLTAATRRGTQYPSESETYVDQSVDLEITRLTDPAHNSRLPGVGSRFLSSRRNFLIYSSDRTGSLQAFRLELSNGEHRQLTDAVDLRPASLVLLTGDGEFVYRDGQELFRAGSGGGRPRSVYRAPEGWRIEDGPGVGAEDNTGIIVERSEMRSRIRVLDLRRGRILAEFERGELLSTPLPRPGQEMLAYRSGDDIRIADYLGEDLHRISADAGAIGPFRWSYNGESLFYLRVDTGGSNRLYEFGPDSGENRFVADVGGMVKFTLNSNSEVFAGARNRAAGSGIVLVLRNGSELTVCEHGASDPAEIGIVFSPDGRNLYFDSDRDGGSAIYTLSVEDLVEPTSD